MLFLRQEFHSKEYQSTDSGGFMNLKHLALVVLVATGCKTGGNDEGADSGSTMKDVVIETGEAD